MCRGNPDPAATGEEAVVEAVVEVAHEALLRVWEPLAEAIERSRERLRFAAELRRDATAWDEQDRPDSYPVTRRSPRARGACSPARPPATTSSVAANASSSRPARISSVANERR
jgi:conflict system STAND superfamily ATPase